MLFFLGYFHLVCLNLRLQCIRLVGGSSILCCFTSYQVYMPLVLGWLEWHGPVVRGRIDIAIPFFIWGYQYFTACYLRILFVLLGDNLTFRFLESVVLVTLLVSFNLVGLRFKFSFSKVCIILSLWTIYPALIFNCDLKKCCVTISNSVYLTWNRGLARLMVKISSSETCLPYCGDFCI